MAFLFLKAKTHMSPMVQIDDQLALWALIRNTKQALYIWKLLFSYPRVR